MLIEVVITSLLVGLIVVATLTGFDVVNRTTAAQRQHDVAAALAAQSQEQLRSDPASALESLETTPHVYTQASGGNTYTIIQEAKILGAGEFSAACNVTQKNRQSGNAIRVWTTVKWHQQEIGHRPAVIETSVITPPIGSGFEVDAGNAPNPTAGIAGVTAEVQYTPTKGGASASVERTTGSEGCVVFAGIPATSALVFIKEKVGYVTINGSTAYPPKEVTLAPNYTTHDPVVYNRGGAITALFQYKTHGSYKHANNEGSGEVEETVAGDTFVAANIAMHVEPLFELGSTRSKLGMGGIYEALPGEPGTYEPTATSPKESVKYPNGNLFPFLEQKEKEGKKEGGENPWTVYTGDCPANDPKTIVAGYEPEEKNIAVHPGESTTVKVPTSYVALSLYKGTKSEAEKSTHLWEALETTHPQLVTITNTKCAGIAPNNEATINDEHTQDTTTEATPKNGGHLEHPFQPFGEFGLCVYDSELGSPTKGKTYTVSYDNTTEAGTAPSIFLGQPSPSEQELRKKEEEKKEAETKAARIKKEEEPRIKREATEATKKGEAVVKENEAYGTAAAYSGATTYALNAEVKSGGLLYKSLKAANKNHNPSTSPEWWSSVKAARESAETKAREAALKEEEKEKEIPRKEAEAEETKTKETREKREVKETEEYTASKVTVESGKTTCP